VETALDNDAVSLVQGFGDVLSQLVPHRQLDVGGVAVDPALGLPVVPARPLRRWSGWRLLHRCR
jgi:hypothetical protein